MRAFAKDNGDIKYFWYDSNTVFIFWGNIGRYLDIPTAGFSYSTWKLSHSGAVIGLDNKLPRLSLEEAQEKLGDLYNKIPNIMPDLNKLRL